MNFKKGLLFGAALLMSMQVAADSRSEIEARIKPVGQVQIEGDASSAIKPAADEAPAMPVVAVVMTGPEVYKKHCVVCHATGVAGAPLAHDEAIWGARKNTDIEIMLITAIKGEKAMPPKGTCMTCSNDELKAAIESMRKKL